MFLSGCHITTTLHFGPFQPEKTEVPRQKRKYEKKQKVLPLSSGAPHHPGPAVFNAKDLNQYDFPSSDEEPLSQVQELSVCVISATGHKPL